MSWIERFKKAKLNKRTVDKFACFVCGSRFTIKRQARAHEHWQIGRFKDYRLEFGRMPVRARG